MALSAWRRSAILNARRVRYDDPQDRYVWTHRPQGSGTNLTSEHQALTLSAVWACVRAVGDTLAMMPWRVYRKLGDGDRQVADRTSQDYLLHRRPNPEMTAFTFRATTIYHAMLWGNAYSEIERRLDGKPLYLWPLRPERMTVTRNADGSLRYEYLNDSGATSVLPARDVLHMKGISHDGVMGLNFVAYAKRSLGLALDMENDGAEFFARGSTPDLVMSVAGRLTNDARQATYDAWAKRHNRRNGERMAILDNSTDIKPLTINHKDSQWLEGRNFQIQEIARWFRVPLHKIGEMSGATFSNIEQQAQEFITDTLQPWATQLEQEADYKLFDVGEYRDHYSRINMASLLRGDSAARSAYYQTMRNIAGLNSNEVRALEELNSIDGGEKYTMQQGFTTLERIGEDPATPIPPRPEPDGTDDDLVETLADAFRPLILDALRRCERRWSKLTADAKAKPEQVTYQTVYMTDALGAVEEGLSAAFHADRNTLTLATQNFVRSHACEPANPAKAAMLVDWYIACANMKGSNPCNPA